jgi:hypothetical protein
MIFITLVVCYFLFIQSDKFMRGLILTCTIGFYYKHAYKHIYDNYIAILQKQTSYIAQIKYKGSANLQDDTHKINTFFSTRGPLTEDSFASAAISLSIFLASTSTSIPDMLVDMQLLLLFFLDDDDDDYFYQQLYFTAIIMKHSVSLKTEPFP